MDENLVGYLLNALEPEDHRQVEARLRDDPEAQHRLELLQRALEPLAADRDEIEPPSGLVLRTLASVAEYRCRPLPQAPAVAGVRSVIPSRRWWKRADLLVAAGIFFAVLGVGIPKLNDVRRQKDINDCANNLRDFHRALVDYGNKNGGYLPDVANQRPPRNVAGMVVPVLDDSAANGGRGLLNVRCPTSSKPQPHRWSLTELEDMDPEEFQHDVAPDLLGCYSYSLGHHDPETGRYHGPHMSDTRLPLMADRPPADRRAGNSPNHGGRGQNVLRVGGDVEFHESPMVDDDHIYLNDDGEVAAGVHRRDAVLGSSADRPNPENGNGPK